MPKSNEATKIEAPMSAEDYLLNEDFKSGGDTPLDMNDAFGSVKALIGHYKPIEDEISKVRPVITNAKWIVVAMITSDLSGYVTKNGKLAKHCKQKKAWSDYLLNECGLGENSVDSYLAACAPQDNQNWKLIPAKSTFEEVAHTFRTNGLTSLGKIKARWQLGEWSDEHQDKFEKIIEVLSEYIDNMTDRDKASTETRISTAISFAISRNKK